MKALWAKDHWIALVTKTLWGGGEEFDVWFISPINGEWQADSKLSFTQLYSVPPPTMSADGNAVTLYSRPAACNLPASLSDPTLVVESNYELQNGKYQCISSRPVPTAIPTRTP
jgi:hypothetical protein